MAIEPLGSPPHTSSSARSTAAALAAVRMVLLDTIVVPNTRLRGRVEVDGLRESIAANGLLQPVVLDASMNLVCGLHRLEAVRELGWSEIPAVVRNWTPAEARLAEIDENLCRRELSVLERAEHIALRRRVWEELRATREAAAAKDENAAATKKTKKKTSGKKEELAALAVFVDDTSKRTGRAASKVREEIKIGELPEEVRSLARETNVSNNRRELLALTRMAEQEQREALERVRTGESKSVRKKKKPEGPDAASLTSDNVRDRLAAIMDADVSLSAPDAAAGLSDAERLSSLRAALEDARKAIERALALWPADEAPSDDGEPQGADQLRGALRSVRRLADQLRDRAALG